jgi:Protein of unknown function (DUF3575).
MGLSMLAGAQKLAVKTNLLYDAGALSPNIGLEMGLGPRTSIYMVGAYNPWNLEGSEGNNRKRVHWLGNIEYRRWLRERFNGHFLGVHILGTRYNVGGYKIPLLFEPDFRYEGWAVGAGLSWGYHWVWSPHWGLEFNAGWGYAYMQYDTYSCKKCGEMEGSYSKHYFGPTRAGISLVFMIR